MAPSSTAADLPLGADFHDASAAVVDFLSEQLPIGAWAVTRTSGDDWTMLEVRDRAYDITPGAVLRWSDSYCSRMVRGEGPFVAVDAQTVAAYAGAEINQQLDIGAYVGIPVRREDGSLFGTLCGIDPVAQDDELAEHEPMLRLLGQLLGTILEADLRTTELQRVAERSATDAETDALTGMLNRRGWDDRLEREQARVARFGDPATVLIGDLDMLKQVNDTHGHEAGDALLQATAATIRAELRPGDVVARIGGDEFAMLLPGLDAARGERVAARLERVLDARDLPVSIGHAVLAVGEDPETVCARADERMYAAKAVRRGAAARG